MDAALGVCAYLQHRCEQAPGGQLLFSLADGGAGSSAFALEYAGGCGRLQGVWRQEAADAAARKRAHWAEVLRKQRLAAQLRIELSQLQSEGRRLDDEYNRYNTWYMNAKGGSWEEQNYRQSRNRLSSQRSANQSEQSRVSAELREAEKAPPPVLQPLPSGTNAALTWLFFLHMPPLLRRLSRAAFLAQQALLPHPCTAHEDVCASLAVQGLKTHLTAHYNTHRYNPVYHPTPQQPANGAEGDVRLWSYGSVPNPDDVGPRQVDSCYTEDHGVWHPDKLSLVMAWQGSSCQVDAALGLPAGWFNPWALGAGQQRLVVDRLTEALPREAAGLQWAMPVYGGAEETARERGNVGIASQGGAVLGMGRSGCWATERVFSRNNARRNYLLWDLWHCGLLGPAQVVTPCRCRWMRP